MKPEKQKQSGFFPTLWSDFFDNDRYFPGKFFEREFAQIVPAVNIKENGKAYQIEFAAPGFAKGDFNVSVDNNVLTVSAERKSERQDEDEKFTRKEFEFNSFSRSFTLPQASNTEKIDAKYADGILSLNVPKKEEARVELKKQIRVA